MKIGALSENTAALADTNQYSEARKGLRRVNSQTRHKSQLTMFALKIRGKTQQQTNQVMANAAYEGNFAKIVSLVSSQTSDKDRHKVINEASYRESIFTNSDTSLLLKHLGRTDKPKKWYGLTPLAIAAMQGHSNVLEYLLRHGADPTLRGSPSDDEDYNALDAAKEGARRAFHAIQTVLLPGKDAVAKQRASLAKTKDVTDKRKLCTTGINSDTFLNPQDVRKHAEELVQKRERCHLCIALLESATTYWPLAQCYTSHYRTRSYTNRPADIHSLRVSLDSITMARVDCLNIDSAKTVLNAFLVNQLATKLAPSLFESTTPSLRDVNPNGINSMTASSRRPKRAKLTNSSSRRGRRYSDSLCLKPMSKTELENIHAKYSQQDLL